MHPDKQLKKCKLGNVCKYYEPCDTHVWTQRHRDIWFFLRGLMIVIPLLFLTVYGVTMFSEAEREKEIVFLNALPCEKVWDILIMTDHLHEYTVEYYESRCT